MGDPECEVRAQTIVKQHQGECDDIKIMVLSQLLESEDREESLPVIFNLYDKCGEVRTRKDPVYSDGF